MLNEVSQIQKDKQQIFHLECGVGQGRFLQNKKKSPKKSKLKGSRQESLRR